MGLARAPKPLFLKCFAVLKPSVLQSGGHFDKNLQNGGHFLRMLTSDDFLGGQKAFQTRAL